MPNLRAAIENMASIPGNGIDADGNGSVDVSAINLFDGLICTISDGQQGARV